MLCYPQLSTGAIAQYPLTKVLTRRTVLNDLPSGARISAFDPDGSTIVWTLQYQGLTDAERSALETLFRTAEGRLGTFVFLDPGANLLRWSEDLTNAVWDHDPLLQVTQRTTDPDGGDNAFRLVNAAQTTQGLEQQTMVPGGRRYTFSVYVRSDSRTQVELVVNGVSGQHASDREWRRMACTAEIESEADGVCCRLQVPAGSVVEVYGFQLDAQPAASQYHKSTSAAGVYPSARFADDQLEFTASGVDDHALTVRVFSRTRQS